MPGRVDDYRDDVQLRLSDRLDAVAVVEPIPPRRRRDWALTALLALIAIAGLMVDDALPLWARLAPTVLALSLVPFRRQIPLLVVVLVSVVATASVVIGFPAGATEGVGVPAGVSDVVLLYALCRWAGPVHVGIGLAVSITSAAIIEMVAGSIGPDSWLLALPWLAVAGFALAMRYRARAIEARHEQVRLLERHALARELHDTVAHHVSAIAVQAQAGQYVVASDLAAATEALRSIEAIANESIDEMRRMVGILRSDDDRARTVAPASLEVLADPDGRPAVDVRGDVALESLPAGVAAALFRIAQESITNARRHSRGVSFVDVEVERDGDDIRMTIDNDGTPTTRNAGSGFGQLGMRERVEALGGEFESAARPAHGWRTVTSIPLTRVAR